MSEQKQNLKGKRVFIFQQRGWALNIGHFLAKKLQAEGVVLGALTIKPTTHEFITNQKEVKYEMIVSNDEIKSDPKKYLNGDIYPLSEICMALGVDSIWPIVASARNHVRSYKDKYYYSFKQNISDEDIIDYVMATYKSILRIFKDFKPDIIIAPTFGSIPHLMFNLMSKKAGIPMIVPTDAKVRGHFFFSYNYNYNEGTLLNQIDSLNANLASSPNFEKAKKYIADFRKDFKKPENASSQNPGSKEKTFWKKIRHFLSPFYQIFKWYTDKEQRKNYWKNIGPCTDYRPPSIILRDHFAYDRYLKFANNYKYQSLETIKKFAYFPLQVQPEESIDVSAPFFTNQIEVARQVAMALPDDYTLVVKEHPAMVGLRPSSYLEKIDKTPNVKLADYRLSSEEVLLKSDLVIAPVGTTISEAAFLNKPVIQIGNLGTTLKLPNVWKHTDMTTLSSKIKEVLATDLKTKEYERRLENYVSAVYDTCFEVNYNNIWERGAGEKDILWQAYKKELKKNLSR